MSAPDPATAVEAELCRPLPRRPRWAREPWRLWLRVALVVPTAALLAWGVRDTAWLPVAGPAAVAALVLTWGAIARELWLVAWGRPVRGLVRGRRQRGTHFPRYAVSYEYREMTERGASATLHGTARVPRALYEASRPGQPLTVLHALWNARWHVAYPFARFAARR